MGLSSASAGTRTRVQALATPGDNHYTTLARIPPILQGFKPLSAQLSARLLEACLYALLDGLSSPSLHPKSVSGALAAATSSAPHHGHNHNSR